MKRELLGDGNGWVIYPREWYRTGELYVFGTEGVGTDDVKRTVNLVSNIVREFGLPLQVFNGHTSRTKDASQVMTLIAKHTTTQQNVIDCDGILAELSKGSYKTSIPYGIVVLANPDKYQFKKKPGQQTSNYGEGCPQGLVILRRYDLENAVKHEIGHMIGLNHHLNCVMDSYCLTSHYCEQCKKKIRTLWSLDNNDNTSSQNQS